MTSPLRDSLGKFGEIRIVSTPLRDSLVKFGEIRIMTLQVYLYMIALVRCVRYEL